MRLIYDTTTKTENFNPVCSDKRIHIRLKSSYKTAIGFEHKLSYLITYCLSSFIKEHKDTNVDFKLNNNAVNRKYVWNKYTKEFKQTELYLKVKRLLAKHFVYKDIKLLPRYKGKTFYDQFAYFDTDAVKEDFESVLKKCSLEDFLFNDKYSVDFKSKKVDDLYQKFDKKEIKKLNKRSSRSSSEAVLW